ncbi:MAG: Holliday junction resolvase RuvX [Anaerolineae bacterium]
MRYLALDVGDERIGVAVSDAGGLIARPLEVIRRVRGSASFERIMELIAAYRGTTDVVAIVVGWPLLPDGSEGAQVRSTAAYIEGLRRYMGRLGFQDLPIIRYDERDSTARAQELVADSGRHRDDLDAVAAAVILEAFLNERAERWPLREEGNP